MIRLFLIFLFFSSFGWAGGRSDGGSGNVLVCPGTNGDTVRLVDVLNLLKLNKEKLKAIPPDVNPRELEFAIIDSIASQNADLAKEINHLLYDERPVLTLDNVIFGFLVADIWNTVSVPKHTDIESKKYPLLKFSGSDPAGKRNSRYIDFAEFVPTADVPEIPKLSDDIQPSEGDKRRGCYIKQLAVQYSAVPGTGLVVFDPRIMGQLSPLERAYFKIHEAILNIQKFPRSSEVVGIVESVASKISLTPNLCPKSISINKELQERLNFRIKTLYDVDGIAVEQLDVDYSDSVRPVVHRRKLLEQKSIPADTIYEVPITSPGTIGISVNSNLDRSAIIEIYITNYSGAVSFNCFEHLPFMEFDETNGRLREGFLKVVKLHHIHFNKR